MEEKIIQLKVETKGAEKVDKLDKSINNAEGSTKKLNKETGAITQRLDKLSGGAISTFKNMTTSVKSATLGFKGLRAAVIATGIGALLILVTSLAAAFKRNQEDADKLSEFLAGVGAVVDVLLDLLADLGGVLIDVFTNPKQAIKDLWEVIKQNLVNRLDGVISAFGAVGKAIKSVINLDWDGLKDAATDFVGAQQQIITGVTAEQWGNLAEKVKETGNEIAETARKAAALKNAENALRDATIDNIETQAKLRQIVEDRRLAAEEEGLAVSEQIRLLQEADDAEKELLNNRRNLLKQEIAILAQRQKLSKNTADDNRELAELQASLIDLESQSASQRIRLNRRLNSLRKQEQAEEQEYFNQLQQLRIANLKDAEEKINQETEIKLAEIRKKYGLETELEKELIAQRDAQIAELREAKRLKDEEEEKKRLEGIKAIQDEFTELTDLERLDKEEQKKLAELERLNASEEEKLAIEEAFQKKRDKLADEVAKKEKERDLILLNQKKLALNNLLGATINALGAQSKIGKKVALAQALWNTYEGVTAALRDKQPSFFINLANAGTALATGLSAVKSITRTNVGSASVGGGISATSVTQTAQAPSFNIQQASQGNQIADALAQQNQQPIQAYVVSSSIRSQEALDRNIEQSAVIG